MGLCAFICAYVILNVFYIINLPGTADELLHIYMMNLSAHVYECALSLSRKQHKRSIIDKEKQQNLMLQKLEPAKVLHFCLKMTETVNYQWHVAPVNTGATQVFLFCFFLFPLCSYPMCCNDLAVSDV